MRSTCWYIRSRNRPHRDSKFEKPDYDYYAAIRIRWRYTRVQLNDRRFRMASLDIIAKVEMTTPRARRLWLSLIKSEPLACCDAIKTCQTLQSIQCRISSGKGKELDARKSFTFFFDHVLSRRVVQASARVPNATIGCKLTRGTSFGSTHSHDALRQRSRQYPDGHGYIEQSRTLFLNTWNEGTLTKDNWMAGGCILFPGR